MRFLLTFLTLFLSSLLLHAGEKENLCMRVDAQSPSIEVFTKKGSGQKCGVVQAGQNLFRSGSCKTSNGSTYCPIAFRDGACNTNLGGIGWIKKGNTVTNCIVDYNGAKAFQDDDPVVANRSGQASCYQIDVRSTLNVRLTADSSSKVCGRLSGGQTVTPVGACGDFWCPVFFYSDDASNTCKGVGYINKGRFTNKYVNTCSEEVTNERLRRIAQYNAYRMGRGDQNYTGNSEIASSGGSNFLIDDDYGAFNNSSPGGSLAFRRRCTTNNCNKAARDGNIINNYDGCSGDVRFGTTSGGRFRCTSSLPMSSPMQNALTTNLPNCVKVTARKLGLGEVNSMRVAHFGCFNYRNMRNGRSLSMHAAGAAIDISSITLDFAAGGSQTISMHVKDRARDERFYNLLHQCWSQAGGSCSCGLKYNSGTPSVRKLHKDHMHLTYNCRRRGSC